MITFENVTKEYGQGIKALDEVSFEIKKGEFVFLIGSSGAGKSTIIRLLIKQEDPSSGSIVFNKEDISKIKGLKLANYRRNLGVVFQDFKLMQSRTIRENIEFALEAAGKGDKEIDETTDYVLDLVGLREREHLFPVQLSGGEKQKASIARAMANNPQVLIADEPTGNLDPSSTWDIVQLLNKINNWGTTVIMATHDQDIVDSLQKRVIELENGQIIRDERNSAKYQRTKEVHKVKKTKKKLKKKDENKKNS